ncbi:RagB/SusD family nutrient uptake outer membrane protein [Marinifilum sp.]|uniref:RagB/SusD family nutrient uptake outer membrane protein n=1 Tax=Marinifilum sp. TaxID=2033137 RepID=UPI003BA8A8E0
MKNKILIITLVLLSQAFIACDEWLDVQPVTEIDLVDQISSADGFNETLNGVYINMTDDNLYGHHLIYGGVEQVAQNINNTWGWGFGSLEFDNPETKQTIAKIWKGMYNVIVNNNIILDNIDDKANLFADTDYKIIKAEALAIRAYLHFDLLRMFGDAYQNAGEEPQIPYVKTFERVRYQHLTADKVYENIFADLDQAEAILAEVDPIVGHVYDGNLLGSYNRKYRMNYYAVLALKARVYINKGDRSNALIYAEKLINEYDWKWVNVENLNEPDLRYKDMLFFDEVVSALNVTKLESLYSTWFGPDNNQYHAGNGTTNYAGYAFEVSVPPAYWWQKPTSGPGINDIRFLYLFKENENGELTISTKYEQPAESTSSLNFMNYKTVPLIRISEMMLIAAEASLFTDKTKAVAYIKGLMEQRQVIIEDDLNGLSESELLDIIVKEFRKETYMEGQLMYLYKRLGFTTIPAMNNDHSVTTTAESFIFPLPDNELEFGNIPN